MSFKINLSEYNKANLQDLSSSLAQYSSSNTSQNGLFTNLSAQNFTGVNGYIFKKGDINQLATYLQDILNDKQKRARMGQNSFKIIKDYSPLKCAQGFIRAIRPT